MRKLLIHIPLLLLVFACKTFLWEPIGYSILHAIGVDEYGWNISRFIGVSLIPIAYATGWLGFYVVNRDKYKAVEGILYLTLVGALLLTISSINLTVPAANDYFPFNLLTGITLLEVYFSGSLICILLAFPFLFFVRKSKV